VKRLAAVIVTVTLSATPVLAADMALKAPPLPPAPSWTGWYVGGNVGYGWKDPTVNFIPNDPVSFNFTCGSVPVDTCAPPASFRIGGALGGLQLGYNWQINQSWLLGFETDFDASRIKGTGTSGFIMATLPASFQIGENIKWFGTIRGRVGYLATNNLLLYGTGGLAYGRIDENAGLSTFGSGGGFGFAYVCTLVVAPAVPNCFAGNSSRMATGFTTGSGVEYRLSQNLSTKAEYLYVNLGHGNTFNVVAQTAFGGFTPSSFTAAYSKVDFNVVRVGLNYQFH